VGVSELHPLLAQCIEMRRINVAEITAESLDVTVAEVICENENDVRRL